MTETATPRELIPVTGFVTLGTLAIVVFFGGFAVWALGVRIAGAVIAPGQIAAAAGHRAVQHPDGGALEAVFVREGDMVQAGAILARIEGDDLRSELVVTKNRLAEIAARRARLAAERDGASGLVFNAGAGTVASVDGSFSALMSGQVQLFEARQDSRRNQMEQLRSQSARIESQKTGVAAQLSALEEQRKLIAAELASQASLLAKGLVPSATVQALRREAARLAGAIGEVQATLAELAERKAELKAARYGIDVTRREEAIAGLRDLDFTERELLEQRRTLQARIARLDIRAPISGIVLGLGELGQGAVIRPAEDLLTLVPQDGGLTVEAMIHPMHIDQIQPGQAVVLRLSALDARTTPELSGTLARVSPDAVEDETGRTRFYTATIELDDAQLARLPQGASLRPGMPVEVFIRTGDRSPFSYLAKPFSDYFNRAFRDG
ncbi:MAG: HlyD family type I secretion periplasmic adaptor subunit [Paracoccaceae bacterium]